MIWLLILNYNSSGEGGTQMKMHRNFDQYIFYLIKEICPPLETKSRDHIDDKLILAMFVFHNCEVAVEG